VTHSSSSSLDEEEDPEELEDPDEPEDDPEESLLSLSLPELDPELEDELSGFLDFLLVLVFFTGSGFDLLDLSVSEDDFFF